MLNIYHRWDFGLAAAVFNIELRREYSQWIDIHVRNVSAEPFVQPWRLFILSVHRMRFAKLHLVFG